MVDTWVSLLVAGTLLLIGFAASLAFHRFRTPDFIVLMLLGAALSQIPVAPFGPSLYNSLAPLLPIFTQLTIAFILFEGGLSLRLGQLGRSIPAIVAHGIVAMAATAVLIWFALTAFFGLSQPTALVVAMAFSGPSASIALSFATRMHLDPRAESAIVLEGVLTNVIAVIGVLVVLAWFGAPGNFFFVPYLAQVAEAALLGGAVGYVWARVVNRLAQQHFIYIATIALAIVVYAAAQGFLAENGAVAVFALGIVLGRERIARAAKGANGKRVAAPPGPSADTMLAEFTRFVEATEGPEVLTEPATTRPTQNLRSFSSEVTFALRTFFFVYLGLLLTQQWAGLGTVVASLVVVGAFLIGRLPSSYALGWGLALHPRDTRAVYASMARGMTDVVLILFAAQAQILPGAEVNYVLGLIPTVVLFAGIISAGLVMWAGRSPGEREAKRIVEPKPIVRAVATPAPGTNETTASQRGSPPAPTPSAGTPTPGPSPERPPRVEGRTPPAPRRGPPPG